jgi:hypothetical protein
MLMTEASVKPIILALRYPAPGTWFIREVSVFSSETARPYRSDNRMIRSECGMLWLHFIKRNVACRT